MAKSKNVNAWRLESDNISKWNARVGGTISYIGAQGIHYEYVMPKTYNGPWYENALTVRSKKSATTKYKNGKKPGQYQPIGDRSYFTYYQLKQQKEQQKENPVDVDYSVTVVIE